MTPKTTRLIESGTGCAVAFVALGYHLARWAVLAAALCYAAWRLYPALAHDASLSWRAADTAALIAGVVAFALLALGRLGRRRNLRATSCRS